MKQVLFAALGIVIGFVVGGIGPRLDLAVLQAKLDETRAELALAEQKSRKRPSLPVPGMSEMFEPAQDFDDEQDADADVDNLGDDADPDEPAVQADSGMDEDEQLTAEDIAEEFDIAVDAQRMRAAQSRAALQEQADLSDEDMVEFDNIVDDMNVALAEYGDALMDIALSGEEPEAEEALGLTHEVTGILYDSQTAVNDLVGADGMDETDPSASQVWNHIDLGVFQENIDAMQE
jgi:hypothetical protein